MQISFKYKLSILFILVSLSVAGLGGYFLYARIHDLVLNQLGNHLLDMGKTAIYLFGPEERAAIKRLTVATRRDALEIDKAKIDAVPEGESLESLDPKVAERYMQNPDFQMLVQRLRQIKEASREIVRPYPMSPLLQLPNDVGADPFHLKFSYLAVPLVGVPDYAYVVLLADADYKKMSYNQGLRPATIYRDVSADPVLQKTFLSNEAVRGQKFVSQQWGTLLSIGVPLKDTTGKTFAVLGLDLDVTSTANSLEQLKWLGLLILGSMLILTVFLSLYIANQISQPIQALCEGAEKVRANDFTTEVHIKSQDELGVLATTFNTMVTQIKEYTDELEQKVQDRTAEISKTLTQLESSQNRLVQSEKMAMIGQMVASVAHDINTPLSYVKNNILTFSDDILGQIVELLATGQELESIIKNADATEEQVNEALTKLSSLIEKLTEQELVDVVRKLTDDAILGVNQISEIVLSLRDFARLDQAKIQTVDVHECIESALRIGNHNLKDLVKVTKQYGDNLPKIECVPSKINQVVLNLLNNAADAIKEQGNPGNIVITTSAEEEGISIAIQDNGKGISEDNLHTIYEPFFTTKGAKKGTGLGLAICTQIMEEHQGRIQVESQQGEGTTFTIYLPIHPNAPATT